MKTIFETPGSFDLHSIDTFGVNVKPNTSNPIGYFGTGLKYAIAVLLRQGAKLELYCNGDHYKFYLQALDFRGEGFQQVAYERQNAFLGMWAKAKLPFTTELGKNWELWQAFRELYANTLDEVGTVFTTDVLDWPRKNDLREGYTYIVVDSLEFARVSEKKDTIFLNPSRDLIIDVKDGNVSQGKASNIYYRGMRAFDLPEKQHSLFTWNIIDPLELTEDRTIKDQYAMHAAVTDIVERSTDKAFIKQVLMAPKDTFEHGLRFDYAYSASDQFKEVLKESKHLFGFNSSAHKFYNTHLAPPKNAQKCSDETWILILKALETGRDNLPDTVSDEITPASSYTVYLEAFKEAFER